MKKMLAHLKNVYLNFRISTKMAVLYLFVFFLSMALSWLVYYNLNYRFSIQKSADLSMQTLYSLKSNITSLLENVDFNSRVILSNSEIQDILNNGKDEDSFIAQKKMSTSLALLTNSMPSIESIHVFDNFGHCYGAGREIYYGLKINDISDAPWYKQVMALRGSSLLRLHANDIFTDSDDRSNVSMIRVINDTVSQAPIGILMMDITNSAFQDTYREIARQYGSSVILLNEDNLCIVNNEGITSENIGKILQENRKSNETPVILNSQGRRFIYSSVTMDHPEWKIIMGTPMEEIDQELALYQRISIIIILLNVILLLGGVMVISRLITVPIRRLLESMKGVQKGNFVTVNMHTGKDEIGQLKNGYNLMIVKIQQLLESTIRDQKVKRTLELNVLQEQIKPHFLYNTLDAMGYLSLAGKNAELYEALEALGEFYRKSLSKGEEIITIGDEVDITRDYLLLQKLRYGNIFTASFEVAPELLGFKTLKLILQPLVENSIYHGIRPKGEHGEICVRVQPCGEQILLSVEDNGIGMSAEELEAVKSGEIKSSGFGLRGTLERIRIYYENDNLDTIESVKNVGTKITIMIPKETVKRSKTKNDSIEPSH